MINISPIEIHPMHFHGHFTKEIARDGTDLDTGGGTPRVENTVLLAPGQTIDVEVRMNAPGKGAWIFHCHVLSHVMGPDGKSLLLEEANGGMVIAVAYEDSENFAEISAVIEGMLTRLQQKQTSGNLAPTPHDPLTDAIHDVNQGLVPAGGTP
jgi:hypothetical protein